MTNHSGQIVLSPYAYLAEGYLVCLSAVRRHVVEKLKSRYAADEADSEGWWKGAVKDALGRNRWQTIQDHQGKQPQRPKEDFLDPHDLYLVTLKHHAVIHPSSVEIGLGHKYYEGLFAHPITWRNQFFAHPKSNPPTAAQVATLLNSLLHLLRAFGLDADAERIDGIRRALALQLETPAQEPVVAVLVAGLKNFGEKDGREWASLRTVREYAGLMDPAFNARVPSDRELSDLLREADRFEVDELNSVVTRVRLVEDDWTGGDPTTSSGPPTTAVRTPRATEAVTGGQPDTTSGIPPEWLAHATDAVREVRYPEGPDGWAPVWWCEHFLRSRYGVFPGAEADTGALGRFFADHPELFELAGDPSAGRVRLRQAEAPAKPTQLEPDTIADAIRQAVDRNPATDDGYAPIPRVGQYLGEHHADVVKRLSEEGQDLMAWLAERRSEYSLDNRNGIQHVRRRSEPFTDSAPAHDPRARETSGDDITDRPSRGHSAPTVAQPQAVVRGSASQTVHQDKGSAQAPYPEWADIVVRAIEECSDRSNGWAEVSVVRFHISERRPSFDPSAYGFTTLRNLLASREDLFEVRDGRTGDSVGPDLVRVRERTESIEADTLSMGSRQEPATEGSVGQKAGPTQERDPDWPDWAHLIAQAMEASGLRDGWASLGDVGNHVKRLQPEFEPREHGSSKLRDLIESRLDLFEIQDRRPSGVAAAALWIRIRASRAEAE